MNHFNIPLIWPFKMVPATSSPGIHFDDAWAGQQIRSFEKIAYYKQKWKKADTTKLQIESSLAPEDLKVYNSSAAVVKSIAWTVVHTEVNYKIYELTFDISDLAEGVYFIYQRVTLGGIDWKTISEPIHSKTSWANTLLIIYKHSFNDYDMAWTTGIAMKFRVEAAIMEPDFKRERTDYINQVHDTVTLKAIPFREFVLQVGKAPGVAPWVGDLLNRIFCCDDIDIEGMKYQAKSGSECKITRFKNYPLIGWSQEIVPAVNKQSLQFSTTDELAPGLVAAYNIQTGFFGGPADVPIIEVEQE